MHRRAVALALVAAGLSPTVLAPPAHAGLRGVTVVVDPGHNGANHRSPREINRLVDAGGFQKACNSTGTADATGATESAFNLAVGLALRDALVRRGATVVMTRTDDQGVGPCIDQRGQLASRSGAAVLVSIHADGEPVSGRGFHVISPTVRRGYTDKTAGPSRRLAELVRDELVRASFAPSNRIGRNGLIERGDLGTLNRAGVPAVIVESGNMRNPTEAAELRDPATRARLAEALAAAIEAFVG